MHGSPPKMIDALYLTMDRLKQSGSFCGKESRRRKIPNPSRPNTVIIIPLPILHLLHYQKILDSGEISPFSSPKLLYENFFNNPMTSLFSGGLPSAVAEAPTPGGAVGAKRKAVTRFKTAPPNKTEEYE